MSNIEEDIKILENYLKDSSYKEKENNFFKGSGWEVVDLEIPQAMANVLTEFKKGKKRIKELEEENKILEFQNKKVENYVEELKKFDYRNIKIDEENKIKSPSFTKEQLDLMNFGIALYTSFDDLYKDEN